jgi:lipopolysaccharide export system permease protein
VTENVTPTHYGFTPDETPRERSQPTGPDSRSVRPGPVLGSVKIPLLQRYIFVEVLRTFVFVLGCTTVLLVFVGVFQQATESGLGPLQALKLLPFLVPSMLPFTIPAALLLTVSVVYGRLAGDQEVTAAKSAGIHPTSLMWPALLLGGFLSVGSLLLTDQVIPWSVAKIEQQVVTLMEDIFLERLRTELQYSDPKRGLHVTVAGVEGRRLIHPVFRYVRGNRVVTVQAEEAVIELDVRNQQAVIRMRNIFGDIGGHGRVVISREETEVIRWTNDDREQKPRHLPVAMIDGELTGISRTHEEQRQRQVIDACFSLTGANFHRLVKTQSERTRNLDSRTARFNKLKTEVHSRYALACSCFFFALLGTPFSMLFGKSQYVTSFLLCFIPIVCGYYPLMLGLMTQAKRGAIGPEWSMWIANALLAVLAILVMRRVIRY